MKHPQYIKGIFDPNEAIPDFSGLHWVTIVEKPNAQLVSQHCIFNLWVMNNVGRARGKMSSNLFAWKWCDTIKSTV